MEQQMFNLLKKSFVYFISNWKAMAGVCFLFWIAAQGLDYAMRLPSLPDEILSALPIIAGLEILRFIVEFSAIQYIAGQKPNPFSSWQKFLKYVGVDMLLVYVPFLCLGTSVWVGHQVWGGRLLSTLLTALLPMIAVVLYYVYAVCFSLRLGIWEVLIVTGKDKGFRDMWQQTQRHFGWWTLVGLMLVLPVLVFSGMVVYSCWFVLPAELLTVYNLVFAVNFVKNRESSRQKS